MREQLAKALTALGHYLAVANRVSIEGAMPEAAEALSEILANRWLNVDAPLMRRAGYVSFDCTITKLSRQTMLLTRTVFVCGALLLLGSFSAVGQQSDVGRVLIYFGEFSANLTQEARTTLADVARCARAEKAKAARIEARARLLVMSEGSWFGRNPDQTGKEFGSDTGDQAKT